MRRYLYLILFAVVLALPYVMRRVVGTGASSESTGAAERLVVVTPHNRDILLEFGYAFERWHREKYGTAVRIDYRVPGGTQDVRRLLDNTYRGYRDQEGRLPEETPADIDLVWGGGDYFIDAELKPLGILKPLKLDAKLLAEVFPQATLAGVKLYDLSKDKDGRPAPLWVGVCLSSFGIIYNPDLYRTLGLRPPEQWRDLADEKLFGLLAMADPAHSASAAVAYLMVVQRAMADAEKAFLRGHPEAARWSKSELSASQPYQAAIARGWKEGMRTLVLIAANARYFTASSPLVPRDVGDGQAAAGMAIDFYGRVYQESVGAERCTFVTPAAATAITPDPVAILYGVKGRREELATHFIEFLLSREGQRLWIMKAGLPGGPRERSLRRPPVRRDVYADRAGWTDDVNPFEEAGDFNQRGEWSDLFGDTRLVWAAAWIDSREELRGAYERVLGVRDVQKRGELIRALSDIPVEMKDVAELRRGRKEAEAAKKGDEFRAEQRIEWAKRFRGHYARVAESARE
jgi:ABC-type Fe3+ transport system substrate-binding protein